MGWRDEATVFLTRKTWKYAKGYRHLIVIYVILFAVANLLLLVEPLLVGKILNIVQEQGINQDTLWPIMYWLLALLLMPAVFWAMHGPARVMERKVGFLVDAAYRKYLVEGVMDLPAQWHSDQHSGDIIDKISKATTALFDYSSHFFLVIETVVRLIGSYIALLFFNLHASYIVAFFVAFTIYLIIKYDQKLIKEYKHLFIYENKISAKIFDTISNITTVIVLRLQKIMGKAVYRKIMAPFPLYKRNTKLNEIKWFWVSMSSNAMMFLVMATYIWFSFKTQDPVMIGTIYILYGYIGKISALFFRFAYKYNDIVKQKTAVENAQDLEKEFKKVKLSKERLPKNWNEIEIRNLNFSYHSEDGASLHLDKVSLTIPRKQKIAFVGASGSGKTTLLKVIRNLYSPKHVHLFLDGKELPNGFESIANDVSLIPQDPELFATTIKGNISLGLPVEFSKIKQLSKLASFHDVAMKLPNKYESTVHEKGVNLSGGQKQRLALARGLLASEDKEIILMDEPTSSVDFRNELEIYKRVFSRYKNKTIISSVHRLHLLPLFDQIYFFKKGKIIASGNHRQLLKTSKEFQKIWKRYNELSKTLGQDFEEDKYF